MNELRYKVNYCTSHVTLNTTLNFKINCGTYRLILSLLTNRFLSSFYKQSSFAEWAPSQFRRILQARLMRHGSFVALSLASLTRPNPPVYCALQIPRSPSRPSIHVPLLLAKTSRTCANCLLARIFLLLNALSSKQHPKARAFGGLFQKRAWMEVYATKAFGHE